MRKHLSEEFDTLYILDLGGNVRKGQSGDANVFGIQVGVSINILIKSKHKVGGISNPDLAFQIRYNDETAGLRKERTFAFLEEKQHVGNVAWKELTPDKRHTWLTTDLHNNFDTFIPMGNNAVKTGKAAVEKALFKTYSLGVVTNRDAWAYNFNPNTLTQNMRAMMETYNGQVSKWERRSDRNINVNDFIEIDDTKLKWTRSLKSNLKQSKLAEFSAENVRRSLYRPFTKSHLYFHRMMNECVYVFPSIFPTPETESENRVICVSGVGHDIFRCHIANSIPELKFSSSSNGGTQCFSFYTYNEDGTNRQENITDWALTEFRTHEVALSTIRIVRKIQSISSVSSDRSSR